MGLKMCDAHNKKWKKRDNGMNRIMRQEKHKNTYRKRPIWVPGDIVNGPHRTTMKEKVRNEYFKGWENFPKPFSVAEIWSKK